MIGLISKAKEPSSNDGIIWCRVMGLGCIDFFLSSSSSFSVTRCRVRRWLLKRNVPRWISFFPRSAMDGNNNNNRQQQRRRQRRRRRTSETPFSVENETKTTILPTYLKNNNHCLQTINRDLFMPRMISSQTRCSSRMKNTKERPWFGFVFYTQQIHYQ